MNSLYHSKTIVIPLAEVQHCEKLVRPGPGGITMKPNGLRVITAKTHYNYQQDGWDNALYVPEDEAEEFLNAWGAYRERVETSMMTLKEVGERRHSDA